MTATEVSITAPANEYEHLDPAPRSDYMQAKNAQLTAELRAAVEAAGKTFVPGRVHRLGAHRDGPSREDRATVFAAAHP